ncbi:MAG: hypothetical protein U9N59_08950 [Campylobacterota bacterium]|nr:hypothetical protein [Campylobacterota bacterium]
MLDITNGNITYGLLRDINKTKLLVLDPSEISDSNGTLIELDQNGTQISSNAGSWGKLTVDSYPTLILNPTNSSYRQETVFVLDGSNIKFAQYQAAGEIYSHVLLNKDAKNELYHSLSPNPKIEAQLNNGYTYLSLPSSNLLCDEDVQLIYTNCDKNNTLESVFGVNSNISLVLKYGRDWLYWNNDANANPAYTISKYSTLNPLDGVLVKSSAQTSVLLPFDEDSLIVNDYRNLFLEGWILVSNNEVQTVAQVSSALQAQGKSLVYILLLRDDVWHIYAPTNDSAVDSAIPRLNTINRYESYWVYFN